MADQREGLFEPSARMKKCAVRAFGGARLTLMRGVSIDYLFSNDANASTYSPEELETVQKAAEILLPHAAIKK